MDNGEENRSYYLRFTAIPGGILYRGLKGLFRDNGKEHGSYYLGFRIRAQLPSIKEFGLARARVPSTM